MDFGWYGDHDTSAAVTFLQSQPDVDDGRISGRRHVDGRRGGDRAPAAADARIQAVVAEGATNRVSAGDKAWLSDRYGWRGTVQEGIEWLSISATDLLTDAEPPTRSTMRSPRRRQGPVLLIAAGNVESEGHASRYIAGASPETVDVWVVPDTGHTGALVTDPCAGVGENRHDLPRRHARRQQYGRFLANSSPRGESRRPVSFTEA